MLNTPPGLTVVVVIALILKTTLSRLALDSLRVNAVVGNFPTVKIWKDIRTCFDQVRRGNHYVRPVVSNLVHPVVGLSIYLFRTDRTAADNKQGQNHRH